MSTQESKGEAQQLVKPDAQKGELTAVQVFENQLANYKPSIKNLLAAHGMSLDEFFVSAVNAIKKVPALINADRKTLIGAILTSAELGLPANTPMQLSFIIPYNRSYKEGGVWKKALDAQFQIGYQGWIEIMQRNPRVESIDSGNVYSNEEWHFNKGLREPFSHKPLPPSKRGEYIGSYAIAWIKDSDKPKVCFLYKEEIEEFKKISQGASSDHSPWNDADKDPQKWMYRKTCIKQLSKELPKTREIHKAFQQDNAVEMGGTQIVDDQGYAQVVESDAQLAAKNAEKKEKKDAAVEEHMQKGIFGEGAK